jgi:hypothetical protein
MLVSLKVPDEVYESYGTHNPQNPRLAMEQALQRFAAITPNRKAIIFTGDALSELQGLLGGSFDGPLDALLALRRSLVVKV